MIVLNSLTMRNFLSVGNVTLSLDLKRNGLTLVLGANADTNGGMTRNGAGKTTILQAISFALYGKPLSKIKIPNLTNNINGKQMLVTIEFERNGKTYKIERGRKPDVMKFYVNGQQMKEEDTGSEQGENGQTQVAINNAIGMSHTMFKHIVAMNTHVDPFLRMREGDQRKVIEELLGIMALSAKADVLRKMITQTKDEIKTQKASIDAFTITNDSILKKIAEAEKAANAWSNKHDTTINTLIEQITAMESIDFDGEIKAFDEIDAWIKQEAEIKAVLDLSEREVGLVRRELAAIQSEAKKLLTEAQAVQSANDVVRLETDKRRKMGEMERKKDDRDKAQAAVAKAKHDLEHANDQICVCCDQPIAGTAHLETIKANLASAVTDAETKVVRILADLGHLEEDIAHLDDEIAKRSLEASEKHKALTEKHAAKASQAEEKAKTLADMETALMEQSKALSALPAKPTSIFTNRDEVYRTKQLFDTLVRDLETEAGRPNPHADQVATLRSTLNEIDYTAINALDDDLKHQEFLLKLLTSNDSFIRQKIIDQNLAYLNGRLSYYLEKVALPHKVQFLADLSVEISLLGRDYDFEQLSRGEMNRVIMAMSWSFRDVWESLNESFNLLFVDEMLDQGTDTQGVEAALQILKGMARSGKNIFLISHKDDLIARIDRILMVHKENGFTRFEEDAVV